VIKTLSMLTGIFCSPIQSSNIEMTSPSKPKAAAAHLTARATPTPASILLNYRTGLASFGPAKRTAPQ
jgi:hypothetical protein